jgi:S1-C subfamily serine protease
MKPKLRIVSGARAGYTEVFAGPEISIGRHASCTLRFDAEQDLDVSARHAVIGRKGDRWYVRDIGSRNGTFVNGHRIREDSTLHDTDHIALGPNGPVVEVRLVADAIPDGVVTDAAVPTAMRPINPPRTTAQTTPPRESTTQRVRVEVGRQTRRLRLLSGGLVVTLVAVGGGLTYSNWRQEQRRAAEVAALEARTDSIVRAAEVAVASLRGELEGLATRLRESQGTVTRLQRDLTQARQHGSDEEINRLTRQLEAASQNLLYQQAAARVDFAAISRENQRAVALIWIRFGASEVYSGTAFAVRADGYLITNRHVVAGEDGTRRPTQIAVRFADSRQTYPARIAALSENADLAIIKVDIPGGVPTVRALNARPDTLVQGDPVALIGFPLGMDLPMTGEVARTSLLAGTVSKSLRDVLQVDGYGAEGASGSPIFDEAGAVVGILYGGAPESRGRIVFGVPSSFALELLERLD